LVSDYKSYGAEFISVRPLFEQDAIKKMVCLSTRWRRRRRRNAGKDEEMFLLLLFFVPRTPRGPPSRSLYGTGKPPCFKIATIDQDILKDATSNFMDSF